MLIKTITFEVRKDASEHFEKKFHDDHLSLQAWDTCLGSEVWVQKKRGTDSVVFTAVSRWNNHEDFNAWLKRPEHKEHHRQLKEEHQFDKKEDSPLLRKVAHEYEVLED